LTLEEIVGIQTDPLRGDELEQLTARTPVSAFGVNSWRARKRPLGVAADHPALAGVDDLAAERPYPLDRGDEVCNREIGPWVPSPP